MGEDSKIYGMRLVNHIVAILTVVVLVLSSGAGDFCTLLCLNVNGQAELEEHDCTCTSTHASGRSAEEKVSTQLKAENDGHESCDLCVEDRIGIGDEQLLLGKAPKIKDIVFSATTYLDTLYARSSLTPSSTVSFDKTTWLNMGSLPLRI